MRPKRPAAKTAKPKGHRIDLELPDLREPVERSNFAALRRLYVAAKKQPDRAGSLKAKASCMAAALHLPMALKREELLPALKLYAWLDSPHLGQIMRSLSPDEVQTIPEKTWVRLAKRAFSEDPAALEQLARQSLEPSRRVSLLVRAATLYWRTWRLHDARRLAEAILDDFPQNVAALDIMAGTLSHMGEVEGAIAMTKRVLAIKHIDHNSVRRLRALNSPDAETYATPEYVESHLPLGEEGSAITLEGAWTLSDAFFLDHALELDKVALKQHYDDPASKPRRLTAIATHAAHVFALKGDFERALSIHSSFLADPVPDPQAILQIVQYLNECGRFEQAACMLDFSQESFRRFALPAFQVLLSRDRQGDAFRFYRKRKQSVEFRKAYPDKQPAQFSIAPKHDLGQRVVLYAEGGPGDEIRFASVYGDLAALFTELTITCEPRLASLMCRSFPSVRFLPVKRFRSEYPTGDYATRNLVPSPGLASALNNLAVDEIKRADFACSVLETLADLRPARESFPRLGAYLRADPACAAKWGRVVREISDGRGVRRIAVCWRSMLRSPARQPHYLRPSDLAPLAQIPNAEFWVVQTSSREDEIAELRSVLPDVFVPPSLDLKDDFEGLSALLMNMDHLVSPFVTVGELGGALGVPTTLLSNSHVTTWRRNPMAPMFGMHPRTSFTAILSEIVRASWRQRLKTSSVD